MPTPLPIGGRRCSRHWLASARDLDLTPALHRKGDHLAPQILVESLSTLTAARPLPRYGAINQVCRALRGRHRNNRRQRMPSRADHLSPRPKPHSSTKHRLRGRSDQLINWRSRRSFFTTPCPSWPRNDLSTLTDDKIRYRHRLYQRGCDNGAGFGRRALLSASAALRLSTVTPASTWRDRGVRPDRAM